MYKKHIVVTMNFYLSPNVILLNFATKVKFFSSYNKFVYLTIMINFERIFMIIP